MAGQSETAELYGRVKTATDKFFATLREAKSLETQGKTNLALLEYEQCLNVIDNVFSVPLTHPTDLSLEWTEVDNILQYLKTEKKEILNHIVELQRDSGSNMAVDSRPLQSPPSYQEATRSDEEQSHISETELPVSYNQLSAMLADLRVDIEQSSMATLLVSCDDSQVFFIASDGQVTSPSEKSNVKIFMLEGSNADNSQRHFLCIEDIYYPLVPNGSPCLRTEFGAFLFPDIENRNSSIGVLVSPEHLELFTDVLEDILKKSLRKEFGKAREKGHNISAHIVKGATFLSNGLVKGAEKTTNFMNNSTPGLLNYINPSQSDTHVCSPMKKGVKVAKNVTSTAADVTCYVAGKIGTASCAVGKFLAPHVHKGGTKILTGVTNMDKNEASQKMTDVFDIAAGAIEGFSIVYDGLEKSGMMLANSISNNTVLIVHHKFGNNVSEVTQDTFETVGHGLRFTRSIKELGPKNIVKSTVKQTGRAMMVPDND
ncbi:PREDICTED: protein spartin [Diuraphis noxia]|uniref:protein spartin n=1 Tax=Diuraphis noxia TaxID=143948 RepID=UPI00076398DB|nr:PREDICTED: protein spartin [Diuraphis noxia]XP_015373073.1 PREDICTED: protein spartin [Diuraphis noxia]XP_015373074.1 PREDICTED: protein spartin [Diuraphis noxia]XP_015373075.1 PREDICTED: protein spartin [Diuraphis noxia]